ncbi:MAG: bifunctional nuclease family protein [Gemmatimonadota bacterium]|nr:bifunctional nuclease family protein [Gemmatimonadota bacterium]
MIEVFVSRLGLDSASNSYVVVLQEKDGTRLLPIWIGQPEADSIGKHIHHVKSPRPIAHDLVQSLILGMGARLIGANITRVEDGTYYAELLLQHDGSIVKIDARPSDSIAIALRLGAPIKAAEGLLIEPGDDSTNDEDDSGDDDTPGLGGEMPSGSDGGDDDITSEQLKRYLEALRPEDFGKFKP